MVFTNKIQVHTQGFSDIIDLSVQVSNMLEQSKVKEGTAHLFVVGSTASLTTMEFEPALVRDVKEALERLFPSDAVSHHSQTWGDDNGFSHLRATMMGPSLCVPVENGSLLLGTWQQIVLIDHDNRARNREVIIQVIGDPS